MKTPDPNTPWTEDRCREFEKLEDLFWEVGTINRGSSAIQRIEKVIRLAKELSEIDLSEDRDAFLTFLRKRIIASRFPETKQ